MSTRAAPRARYEDSGRARAASRQAAPAPARPRPVPAPRRRPVDRRAAPARGRARARPRLRLRLGMLVIPLIAVVLGGIVWVNVARLSLTNRTGQAIERARSVEAESARLKARLDQREAFVIRNAQRALGMQMPAASAVTTLRAGRP